MNSKQDENPFASPRPTVAANENGVERHGRLKLIFLSVLVGGMQGGTAGALTGFVFAIFAAVVDTHNIGIMMFLFFSTCVFYSIFVGGLAGALNGVVNVFTPLVSRSWIGLNCLIAGLVAFLPIFMIRDLSITTLCLLAIPVTAVFVTKHLHHLFTLYNPISA